MLSKSQSLIYDYFKKASDSDNLKQCYILHGGEGYGKKFLLKAVQKYILCENGCACGKCNACKSLDKGANPDCVYVSQGDKKTIELAKIRAMIKEAYVKPVMGTRKLIIIENALALEAASQNAILKLVEEPPEYAIFILVAGSLSPILPTIQSRSFKLELGPWSKDDLKAVCPTEKENEFMYSYCGGSLGRLLTLVSDENFKNLKDGTINSFAKMITSGSEAIYDTIDFWTANKDSKDKLIDILTMFLKDVLYFKTGSKELIADSDKIKQIEAVSSKVSIQRAYDMLNELCDFPNTMGKYGNFNIHVQTLMIRLGRK